MSSKIHEGILSAGDTMLSQKAWTIVDTTYGPHTIDYNIIVPILEPFLYGGQRLLANF